MVVDRLTALQDIKIWQPRWHDRKVLIAKHKIGNHNRITFLKAPTYSGEYYLSGETIRKHPVESNGTIDCYAVPVDELTLLERR